MHYGGHLSPNIYNVIILVILFPFSFIATNFMPNTCMVSDLCMAWQNVASVNDLTKI
jgi:hypothetical protein